MARRMHKVSPNGRGDNSGAVKYANRAAQFMESGQFEKCAIAYKRLIGMVPANAAIYHNLAVALQSSGKDGEAVKCYEKALKIDPDWADSCSNLGALLFRHNQHDQALEFLERAVKIKPDFADAYQNLGLTFTALGRTEDAINAFRNVMAFNPNSLTTFYELCGLRRQTCDWSGLEDEEKQCLQSLRQNEIVVAPFNLLAMTNEAAELLQHNRIFARSVAIEDGKKFRHRVSTSQSNDERPIRIGYLSADFRQHAMGSHMVGLMEQHDRERFQVFGYCYSKDDGSQLRDRLIAACDKFVPIHSLANRQAAQRIYDDKIDILIDLNGYTGNARTEILAFKPAPTQVSLLGYPSTMGAEFMDYIIADEFIAPFNHQEFFDEAIVHLPDTYQPNDRQRKIAEYTPTRAESGLPESGFVFCSFNHAYKITEAMFDIWMRLLEKTEGSVLWLLEISPLSKANLKREAEARNIDPDRLIFASPKPMDQHLARLRVADLFLDSVPVNAHATAADALWVGVPVLTCAGKNLVGRVAGSLLNTIGLSELVTDSHEAYEALALHLSSDPALLLTLREKLAKNRLSSPLFDIEKYTSNIEAAYSHMVHRQKAGEQPTQFAVSQLPTDR